MDLILSGFPEETRRIVRSYTSSYSHRYGNRKARGEAEGRRRSTASRDSLPNHDDQEDVAPSPENTATESALVPAPRTPPSSTRWPVPAQPFFPVLMQQCEYLHQYALGHVQELIHPTDLYLTGHDSPPDPPAERSMADRQAYAWVWDLLRDPTYFLSMFTAVALDLLARGGVPKGTLIWLKVETIRAINQDLRNGGPPFRLATLLSIGRMAMHEIFNGANGIETGRQHFNAYKTMLAHCGGYDKLDLPSKWNDHLRWQEFMIERELAVVAKRGAEPRAGNLTGPVLDAKTAKERVYLQRYKPWIDVVEREF